MTFLLMLMIAYRTLTLSLVSIEIFFRNIILTIGLSKHFSHMSSLEVWSSCFNMRPTLNQLVSSLKKFFFKVHPIFLAITFPGDNLLHFRHHIYILHHINNNNICI